MELLSLIRLTVIHLLRDLNGVNINSIATDRQYSLCLMDAIDVYSVCLPCALCNVHISCILCVYLVHTLYNVATLLYNVQF